MYCPVDGSTLVLASRHDVEIDFCPDCRGVWLDCGELGEVVDHSDDATGVPAPDALFLRVALDAEAEELRCTIAAHTATLDEFATRQSCAAAASMNSSVRPLDALAAVEQALEQATGRESWHLRACREPIAAARLEAVPSTEHCIRCVAG